MTPKQKWRIAWRTARVLSPTSCRPFLWVVAGAAFPEQRARWVEVERRGADSIQWRAALDHVESLRQRLIKTKSELDTIDLLQLTAQTQEDTEWAKRRRLYLTKDAEYWLKEAKLRLKAARAIWARNNQ